MRKLGYGDQLVPVTISAADTVSITVVLKPLGQRLPAVVTRVRAPTDTVRRLDILGFYDRKRSSGAPEVAFVTADQLSKWNLSKLTDVRYHTGRSIGPCDDVYVNGVLLTNEQQLNAGSKVVQRGPYGFYRRGIDAIVSPDDVLAMELYRVADAPAQYQRTRSQGCGPEAKVILIWLK